jgi:hypothetical protein
VWQSRRVTLVRWTCGDPATVLASGAGFDA